MIRKVSDIMDKNFLPVRALDSVLAIQNLACDRKIDYFPVVENDRTIGVVTYKQLILAHPNRIAADAMTSNFSIVDHNVSIWEVKSIYEEQTIDLIIVEKDHQVTGLITNLVLDIEFGKHFDLLTGLHKTDYIFYHAFELMKKENEISIIFFDVNNFGLIDKKLGHIYGDNVLKEIAQLLNHHKPEGTFLCRFGGDEFVVLTPFEIHTTKKIAEELLQVIAEKTFCDEIRISISAGISGGRRITPRNTEYESTLQNLINIASLACSQAKKNTNKLCIELGTDNMGIA